MSPKDLKEKPLAKDVQDRSLRMKSSQTTMVYQICNETLYWIDLSDEEGNKIYSATIEKRRG
ncbi:hypothetical protein ARMGADRAFT_1014426, partial [Armillaria gallica]